MSKSYHSFPRPEDITSRRRKWGCFGLKKSAAARSLQFGTASCGGTAPTWWTTAVEQLTTQFWRDMCSDLAVSQQMKGRETLTAFEERLESPHLESWEYFPRTSIEQRALLFTCALAHCQAAGCVHNFAFLCKFWMSTLKLNVEVADGTNTSHGNYMVHSKLCHT